MTATLHNGVAMSQADRAAAHEHDVTVTQAALASSAQDLAKELAGGIAYRADNDSPQRDGAQRRIAIITCSHCAGTTMVHQSKAVGADAFAPDAPTFMSSVMGWLREGEHFFCGVTCRRRHEVRRGQSAPHAVAMHGDPNSYARRMYADRAAAKAVTLVTPGPAPSQTEPSPAPQRRR